MNTLEQLGIKQKKEAKITSRQGLELIYAAIDLHNIGEHPIVVKMLLDQASDAFFNLHEQLTDLQVVTE